MSDATLTTNNGTLNSPAANSKRALFQRYEFLAFSIVGFIAKSWLLVRLPYRDWYINSTYTTLILTYFYCYFRFRFKAKPPLFVIFCMVMAVGMDVIGNLFHFYGRAFFHIEYDEYTHFLGSACALVPAMWILRTTTRRMGFKLPGDLVGFLSVTITFSFCAYYEILELWDELFWKDFERIHGSHDTSNDLMWDLGGIIIAALLATQIFKLLDRREDAAARPPEGVKTAGLKG